MVNGAWHTLTAAAAELSSVTRLAAAAEPRAIGQFCDHPLAAHRPGVGVRAPAVPERPCSPARLRRLYDLMRCNVTLMSRSRGHSDIITLWLSDDGEAHLKSIVKQLFSPPKQKQSIRSSSQHFLTKIRRELASGRSWWAESVVGRKMETCILIPPELSVILRPNGRRGRLLEMEATLWTNCALRPGFTLLPDDGELRLDRLELFTDLSDKDVCTALLCYLFPQFIGRRPTRHTTTQLYYAVLSESHHT